MEIVFNVLTKVSSIYNPRFSLSQHLIYYKTELKNVTDTILPPRLLKHQYVLFYADISLELVQIRTINLYDDVTQYTSIIV